MTKKRPHAGEGHPGLPRRFPVTASGGPRRLIQVADDTLAALGIRAGDAVVLVPRAHPEHGDLVVLGDPDGALRLWRAWPEAGRLRLTRGEEQRDLPPDAPIEGVVVAVRRTFTQPR